MAYAVIRRPLTIDGQVPSRKSPSAICGGEVAPEQVFVPGFSPVTTFLPFHRYSIPAISDTSYFSFLVFSDFEIYFS
jgi:hypothetical protein